LNGIVTRNGHDLAIYIPANVEKKPVLIGFWKVFDFPKKVFKFLWSSKMS